MKIDKPILPKMLTVFLLSIFTTDAISHGPRTPHFHLDTCREQLFNYSQEFETTMDSMWALSDPKINGDLKPVYCKKGELESVLDSYKCDHGSFSSKDNQPKTGLFLKDFNRDLFGEKVFFTGQTLSDIRFLSWCDSLVGHVKR